MPAASAIAVAPCAAAAARIPARTPRLREGAQNGATSAAAAWRNVGGCAPCRPPAAGMHGTPGRTPARTPDRTRRRGAQGREPRGGTATAGRSRFRARLLRSGRRRPRSVLPPDRARRSVARPAARRAASGGGRRRLLYRAGGSLYPVIQSAGGRRRRRGWTAVKKSLDLKTGGRRAAAGGGMSGKKVTRPQDRQRGGPERLSSRRRAARDMGGAAAAGGAAAGMRDKLTGWRQRRREQATLDAIAKAGYFEQTELDDLDTAAQQAQLTAATSAQEYIQIIEQAERHSRTAAEYQRDAWQADNDYQVAARRGPDEEKAAAAVVAAAWNKAAEEAQTESDTWKAAARMAWKEAAAVTECIRISEVMTMRAIDHAGDVKGKERKAAAVRIKAAQDWEKQVNEWAKLPMERINLAIAETTRYGAKARAWAAGAYGMAKAWADKQGAEADP